MSRRRWIPLPAAVVVTLGFAVWALVQDDPDVGALDDDPKDLEGAVSILDCAEAPHDPGVGVYNFTSTFACEVDGERVTLHGLPGRHAHALRSLTAGAPLPKDQRVDPLPGCAVVVVDGPDWVAVTGTISAGRSIADRTGGRQLPTTTAGPPVSYPFCP